MRRTLGLLALEATVAVGLAVVLLSGATSSASSGPRSSSQPPASVLASTATDVCTLPASRVVPVATTSALKAALLDARPGDRIQLADGTYGGTTFTAATSGTPTARIRLCGGRNAVLQYGAFDKGVAFHLRASHWDLKGFTVANSQKGVMLDRASFNVLDGLTVHTIGDEGVHFRTFSTNNRLVNSVVRDTGLRVASYGESVYVGSASSNWCTYTDCAPDASDFNVIEHNRLTAFGSEAVDLKEGTTGGVVRGNSFDRTGGVTGGGGLAWVDVKGNGWTIASNTGRVSPRDGFLTSIAVSGWGTGNTFAGNTADVLGPGYGYNVRPGNVVLCTNVATNAAKGLSNIACSQS